MCGMPYAIIVVGLSYKYGFNYGYYKYALKLLPLLGDRSWKYYIKRFNYSAGPWNI